MVNIRKGEDKTMTVSASVFKNIFAPAGWELDEPEIDERSDEDDIAPAGDGEPDGQEFTMEELVTIPVSDMTSEQLKQCAAFLDIDLTGKSKKDVKKEITEALANG